MPELDWSVLIPCFNEAESIEDVVSRANLLINRIGMSGEIVVVDDGSADDSLDLLKKLMLKYPCLRVISHHSNYGIGYSWRTLYSNAKGKYVLTCPADNQFDPMDAFELARVMNEKTVYAICRKNRYSAYRFWRNILTLMSNYIASKICRFRFQDVNWVKIYPMKLIDLKQIASQSSFLETEILHKLVRRGCTIKQVDLPYKHRVSGCSHGSDIRNVIFPVHEAFLYICGKSSPRQRAIHCHEIKGGEERA